MKLDEEYIKSLPLTTNKINVIFDREVFFSRYSTCHTMALTRN